MSRRIDRILTPLILPLALVLSLATWSPAHAALEEQNVARGFSPEKSFEVGEIDHVNLFNGNLVLTLPLGAGLDAGPGFGVNLALVYNAKLWDFAVVNSAPTIYPGRHFNAGLGFRVSLGRVLSPTAGDNDSQNQWVYEAPDGSRHVFFQSLHPGGATAPNTYYTRDSTYLRLKVAGNGGPAADATVHFPDGRQNVYRLHNGYHRPWTMRDAHGNTVSIDSKVNPWKITGPHGRIARIYFDTSASKAGWYSNREGVVTKVEWPGPPGHGVSKYEFTYDTAAPEFWTACAGNGPEPAKVKLPLLRSVELPDGSTYEFPIYNQPLAGCEPESGLLREAVLPTKGILEWDYEPWKFPAEPGSCKDPLHQPMGVTKRTARYRTGIVSGTRMYAQTYTGVLGCTPNMPTPPKETKTVVTNSLGHEFHHFFSISRNNSGSGTNAWQLEEYALPLTHGPSGSGGGFLSTETYQGSTKLRSTYVRYEWDTADQEQVNQRLAFQRTVFHDDNNRHQQTLSSDFDGLGNYRTTTQSSNLEGDSYRQTTTRYNPGLPAQPHQGVSGVTMPSPWLLGLFDQTTVTNGSDTAKELFCFDDTTGQLKRHRVLKGAGVSGQDLLRVYDYTATSTPNGNRGLLTGERFYGGDLQWVNTGSLCTLNLPGSPSYELTHTISHGERSKTQYLKSGGSAFPFTVLRRNIHQASGLPTADFSPAGIATYFEYDSTGRPTWIKPATGHDGWVKYTYVPATTNGQATVGIQTKNNGTKGGLTLAQGSLVFDDFGRIYRENTVMPDGTRSQRQTLYNGEGWKTDVSERTVAGAAWRPGTKYSGFDPFGRPGFIRPAEGSHHTVELDYDGVRKIYRRVWTGTGRAAAGNLVEEKVTTQEVYDGLGRLFRVRDYSDPAAPGSLQNTEYSYDEAGRLTGVNQGSQSRTFTYDNRGFLLSERHPEKGASGNGSVFYSNYDARGHAGRKVDGPWTLTYSYDRAERLTKIQDSGGQVWKQFVYDNASHNEGAYAAGQLVRAIRHNPVPIPWIPGRPIFDVAVTEDYTYNGRGGRASSRRTTLNTSGYDFQQSFVWDPLGNLLSQTYPSCVHTTCTGSSGANPPRTVNHTYAKGFLTNVTGFGSFTYHPNFLLHQVWHTNGVTDTQANDPYLRRRPYSISTTAVPVVLGPYEYDGAGNITAIAGNQFLYDKVNRLVEFEFESGQTQDYTFDRYGNLTSMTTDEGFGPVTRTMPVVSTTNRLSGAAYDATGAVTSWGGYQYTNDPFGLHIAMQGGGNDKAYFYTADDERIYSLAYDGVSTAGNEETWTLRGLDGKVLREWQMSGGNAVGNWSLTKDYIYRAGQLLAHVTGGGSTVHYTLDHLGSPRLLTNGTGGYLSDHHYYGFGQELAPSTTDPMKFTGHERDFNASGGTVDDLDYMHARYYSAHLGRFLSVDPAGAERAAPQSWNRYTNGRSNPMKFVDPDGKDVVWFARDDAAGGMTNFGHTALRVVGEGYDKTFDFGRYRGGRGFLSAKGPGILRVWNDFAAFVAAQEGRGSSAAARYETTEAFDRAVIAYFESLIKGGMKLRETISFTEYQLAEDYHLQDHNCTTICVDALAAAEESADQSGGDAGVMWDLEQRYRATIDPREIYQAITDSVPSRGNQTITFFRYKKPEGED